MLKQKTLKESFSLRGKGLHTGLDLTVTFNPAPDNHGYKIQRTDLEGQPIIDAVADNVGETTRGTVLSKNGVKVSTVEHGMAALYALGIDNCLIQVNGPEFPILDGSAQYYVQEIEKVGIEEQNAVKDFYIIKSKIEFRDEETGSSIIVLPDENFSLNVLVSYDSTIIPNQFATLEDMKKFKDEIAPSRTFVFVREIEPLLSAGLEHLPATGFYLDGVYQRVAFHGVPGGKEINSFVIGIYNLAGPGQEIAAGTLKKIGKLKKPVHAKICVSLACHHCPGVVIACQQIAMKSDCISAEMYDANLYPDLVERYKIERVPLVALNDRDVFMGPRTIEDLVQLFKDAK